MSFGPSPFVRTLALSVLGAVASPPDDYTVGISPSSAFTLAYHFQNIWPHLLEATSAMIVASRQRISIAAKSDNSIRTPPDSIDVARKQPGELSVGIPGMGTMVERIAQAIIWQAKVVVNIVPFQGDAPIVTVILGGHVTVGSFAAGGWAPQIGAGTLRLLASMEVERAEAAPRRSNWSRAPLKGARSSSCMRPGECRRRCAIG